MIMKKNSLVIIILLGAVLLSIVSAGCTQEGNPGENPPAGNHPNESNNSADQENVNQENVKPSLAGISLGDPKETVEEKLGQDYEVADFEEAGHFPETFYSWEYENGTVVYLGKESGKVLEIHSSAQGVGTNLGVKIGDSAKTVLGTYRAKYTEPESIHGFGKLTGVFKVEGGAALLFDFNQEDGIVNPEGVEEEDVLERIILTYPAHIDEDF